MARVSKCDSCKKDICDNCVNVEYNKVFKLKSLDERMKNKKEKQLIRQMKQYYERKQLNLCVQCGEKKDIGTIYCIKCLKDRKKKYYNKKAKEDKFKNQTNYRGI